MKKPVLLLFLALIAVVMAITGNPPTIDPISDVLIVADNEVTFTATAVPSGAFWSIDGTSIEKGMQINPTTGLFSWTPTLGNVGNHTVTVTATDAGGSDNVNFLIQVTELLLDPIGDQFVDEINTLNFTASATVAEMLSGPDYSLEDGFSGAVPSGASINPITGLFEWQTDEFDGPGFYFFDVVATATDPQTLDTFTDRETISVEVFEVNAPHSVDPIGDWIIETDTLLAFTSTFQDSDIPLNEFYFWTLDATSIGKGMQINNGSGDFTWIPTAAQVGIHAVTVTIEDDGDPALSDELTFNIEVIPPPITLDPIDDQSVDENLLLSFTANATVPDMGGVPVYSLDVDGESAVIPEGASIDPNTGVFSWQTDETNGGEFYFFFVVATRSDDTEVSVSEPVFIEVFDVNEPPLIDPISDAFIDLGFQFEFTATAFDPDDPVNFISWTLDVASLNKGMSIVPETGDFFWEPTAAQVGSHSVTLIATDDGDPSLDDELTFNIEVSLAIFLDFLDNESVEENSFLSFIAHATLPEIGGGPGLTIQAEEIGNDVVFSWGGSGQSLDLFSIDGPSSGTVVSDLGSLNPGLAVFQSLPAAGSPNDVYTIPSFSGWGPFGSNVASTGTPLGASLNLGDPDTLSVPSGYVSGSIFPAGTLTFPNQTLLDLGVDTSITHTLGILPSGDTITLTGIAPIYSLADGEFGVVPPGASIDPNTGVFGWLPDEIDGPGLYFFDVVATRSDDPAVSAAQSITVEVLEVNESPFIDPISDMVATADAQIAFTATAFDPDEPLNSISWTLDTSSGAKGMSINPSTGEFSWTPTGAQVGNHSVLVTAVDDGDPPLMDSLSFYIDVDIARTITLDVIGDQSIDENFPLSFTASAMTVGGSATPIYLLQNGEFGFVPSGASIDPNSGVFSWQTDEIDGPGIYSFDVVARRSDAFMATFGFTGNMAPENWSTTEQSPASNFNHSESSLSISTGGGGGGTTRAVTIPQDGTIGFDWTFQFTGSGGFVFQYEINNVATEITSVSGSGSIAGIEVQAGDVFELYTWGRTQASTYSASFSSFEYFSGFPSDDAVETISVEVFEVNTPPVIDPVNGQVVEADSVIAFNVTAQDVDLPNNFIFWTLDSTSQNKGMSIDFNTGNFIWTPTAAQGGTHAVTVTATDDGDPPLIDTETFNIEVTVPITLNPIGDKSIGENNLLTFVANATIPGGMGVPIYSLEEPAEIGNLPGGASIDPNTGDFSWQTTETDGPGTYIFDVVATRSDNASAFASETISVEVFEVNAPPLVDPVNDMSVEANSVLAFNVTAQNTDVPVNSISWTLDGASQTKGMSINSGTGNFVWTPTAAQAGSHSVTVTATDDGNPPLSDNFAFNIQVTLSITLNPVGDKSIGENNLLTFVANATIPGGMAVPIYSLEEPAEIGNLPSGASIDPNTGDFSWQTTETDGPGTYIFDVVATRSDNAAVFDSETITVEVFEGNTPPTIAPISDRTVDAGTLLTFTAMASDPDVPPNGISWTLDGASTGKGMSISLATGVFNWTPTAAQAGNHPISVTATDDGAPPLTHTFTFAVEVTLSITLDPVGDKSIGETNLLSFTANATIPGGIAEPIYSLEQSGETGGIPDGAVIDPNTGVFSWQTTENDGPGTYIFDVVATRSDNGSVFDSETITVEVFEGNLPPTIAPISDRIVDAGTMLVFTAMASDPDVPPNGISWSIDAASAEKGMQMDFETGTFSWTPTAAQAGNHSITVSATDDGDPTLNDTFTFTIEVILSITLDLIGDKSLNENDLLSFTANATIPGDIAVPVYSLEGAVPAAASIDPNSGNFSWQTTETDGPGSFVFDIVATRSDNASVTDRETISVGVFEGNAPPTIDPFSDMTVDAGTLLSFTAMASDPDVPPNGISWSIDGTSSEKGMQLDFGTGAFSWTPTSAQAGTHLVTITATDDGDPSLNDAFAFTIEVTLSITLDLIGDKSVSENDLLSFTANANVPGGIAVPVFSLEGAVPNAASIDPSTGNFSWQTNEIDGPGSYVFDIVAARSDNASITDRETISVGVFEGNAPPTIDPFSDMTVDAGTLLSFTAMASDPDVPPNGISWSIDGTSSEKGMQLDFETGAFSWTPTSAQAGTHLVTIAATDDGDPSLNDAFAFTIEVTLSITLDLIGDKSVSENNLLSFTANANVPGGIAVPVFSLGGAVPNGASIDPSTGNFSWQTNEIDGPGTFVFDVVAARSDNASITDRETISVGVFEGNAPPTIDPLSDMTVDAGTLLSFTAMASDPDVPPNGISWSIDGTSSEKGMQLDFETGAFSWTPTSAQAGTHLVTIAATDDGDPSLNDAFAFTIEVTLSITLNLIGDKSVSENNLLSFTANATVPGGIAVPVFSLEGAVPNGASIDPSTGNFSWQTNEIDGPGTYVFDVVAARSDNASITDRETISVGVFEGNAPPTIDPLSDMTIDAGTLLSFTAMASDPDVPPNGISWSVDDASAEKGMQIDSQTGAFGWTPDSAQAGTHLVSITATDDGAPLLNDTFNFSIEVTLSINLDAIGDQSIVENNLLGFVANATVPGDIAVPIYALEGAVPTGASIDPSTGNFSWQTDESDGPGSYVFDVVAARSDNASITDRETITVGVFEGNAPPTIDPIGDKTVDAGMQLAFAASASDPDLPPNGISWTIDGASAGKGMSISPVTGAFNWTPTSSQAGTHLVTVTATDDGDPLLNDAFNFSIEVTLFIALDVIGDKSIGENGLLSFTANATVPGGGAVPIYSLQGSVPNGASIDPNTGRFLWQTDESDGPGSYVFDVVARRSDSAAVTARETISVGVFEDNTPPTIDPIGDKTVDAGVQLAFTASASDPDLPANGISWTVDRASAGKGLSINPATGAFNWTPSSAQAGNHSVSLIATDTGDPSLNDTFSFNIQVTLSITLDFIGDQSIDENSVLSFTANATVPGGIAVPVYSLEGSVPSGASIDPGTGTFSWQTDESDGPGLHVFDVVATRSDSALVSDRETLSVIVLENNTRPTIDPIGDMTVDAGTLLIFTAKASDPDVPPNGITWTIDAASAAKGMQIITATGAFSWIPASSHAGNHSVTVTATDGGDPPLSDAFTFSIQVALSIELELIGDKSISEGSLVSFTANATVPGGIAVPVYSLEGAVPSGASIDPSSGLFSWQTDENDGPGSYVFDVVAARSDNAGITDRETISVGVFEGNTPPTIAPISAVTVDAGTSLGFTASAIDPDVPPNGISWTLDAASAAKGMQINAETGAFAWTPAASHAGNHSVTVTATDDGIPSLNHTFTFTIEVTLSIVLELIGDKSISEGSLLSFTANATVPGGIAVPVYSLEGSVPGGASIDPNTGNFSWQTNESDGPGSYVFDVVAARSDIDTVTDRETISVGVFEGNTPPTIDPIGNMTVDAGMELSFTSMASDPDVPPNGIFWTLDAISAAKGMQISAETGAFSWTPISSQAGNHLVIVTATDNGEPSLSAALTFTIEVTLSIALEPIGDKSVDETNLLSFTAKATVPGGIAVPVYSLEGSVPSGATIDLITGDFSWQTDENDGPGSYVFDVVAARSDRVTVTARETISVGVFEGNAPPTIDPISTRTVDAGMLLGFTATASDPDVPPNGISWTIDGASAAKGMQINAATGAFSWTPISSQAGNHSVTVTATDDGDPILNHSYTFTVEVTLSIILDPIGNKTIGETNLLSFTANATVPGGIAVPLYSLEGSVPSGASIDPLTGDFSWQTGEDDGPGTYIFDVVATRSDRATVTDRETISVGVFEGNAPPTIDPISTMTVSAGSPLGFTATASDPDVPPNGVFWAIDAASAAKGMSINLATGAFSWTPASLHAGSHSVTVIAFDDGLPPLDNSFTFTIDVTLAITLDAIGDKRIAENTLLSFTANATTAGGNATPVYSLQNGSSGSVPAGASINAGTGVFGWVPSESDGPGDYVFDVVATRSDNAAVTARETISVGVFESNTDPIIDRIANMTVDAGSQLAFSATASDADLPPNNVFWTIDSASERKGMGINATTGAFTWTPASAHAGNHPVTVVAKDDGVPPFTDTFTFNIEVTLSIFLDSIGDQVVNENSLLDFTATATVPGGTATPIFSLQNGDSGFVPAGASIDPSTGIFSWQTTEIDGPGTFHFDVVAVRSDDVRATDRGTIAVQVNEVNAPPSIDPINDTTVQAGSLLAFTATASDPDSPPNVVSWTLDGASEAKGLRINATTGAFTWSPAAAQVGNHSVIVTATDTGIPPLDDSVTFSIEVTRATIELNPIDDQSIDENSTLGFMAVATVSAGSGNPVYSLEDGAVGSVPSGASIDPGTGVFHWATQESDGPQTYVFDVVATRSDDATAIDRETVSIEVAEVNESPVIDPISDATVNAFTQLAFTATSADPDLPANLISWTIDGASADKGMQINADTGAFKWTPVRRQIGNHSVTLTAQDSGDPALDDSVTFTIEVTEGEPPVLSLTAAWEDTLHEPNSFSLGQDMEREGPYHFTLTRSAVSGDLPLILRLEASSQASLATDFSVSVVGTDPLGNTPLNFTGNPPTASLTIPDGVATINLRIEVIDDDAAEAAETITLSIVASERFETGTATATQIIPQNDFLVTTMGDVDTDTTPNGGEGTLRHAINNARAGLTRPNSPGAPIVLSFANGLTGEIVLTDGALVFDTVDFSIIGPGSDHLTISGNGTSRVIIANDPSGERTYNISGVHLTNGYSSGNGGVIFNSESLTLSDCTLSNSVASHGGGITNEGELTMERCVVSGNTAEVYGGGIDNFSGIATLTGCTVIGNQAEFGGGIETSTNGEIIIDGCTIVGNNALSGGGVDSFSASTYIVNSTITGNSAGFGAGLFNEMSTVTVLHTTIVSNTAVTSVGGILTSSNAPAGTTELFNTIVAGNTEGDDVPADIATNNPSFTNLSSSSTANLIGDADSSGGLRHARNLNQVGLDGVGVQPLDVIVEPLADNGGLTATHALAFGSPAIDAGDTNLALDLAFDQRGSGLDVGGLQYQRIIEVVDIGAFELQPDRILEVISCEFTAGSDATITWRSSPGESYDILCSTDLQDWIVIASEVQATGQLSSYTEENPPAGQAFFVVRSSLQQ